MAQLTCIDLGRMAYRQALEAQEALVRRLAGPEAEQARQAYLLTVEHDPPVITLGRAHGDGANVLAGPDELARQGIELHHASRGGDVTYHGPGQLVAYPILRLDLHGRDLHEYLRRLEDVVIAAVGELGVSAGRCEGLTGVWVGDEKLCAIGVAVRRWVTYHGLALNCDCMMSHFDLIVPCGLAGKGVTSLSRLLGRRVGVAEARPILAGHFARLFGFDGVRHVGIEWLQAGVEDGR